MATFPPVFARAELDKLISDLSQYSGDEKMGFRKWYWNFPPCFILVYLYCFTSQLWCRGVLGVEFSPTHTYPPLPGNPNQCRPLDVGVTNVVTVKELLGNRGITGEYDSIGESHCYIVQQNVADAVTYIKIEGFSRFDNETMNMKNSFAEVKAVSSEPIHLSATRLKPASPVEYEYYSFCSWLYGWKTSGGNFISRLRCPLHSIPYSDFPSLADTALSFFNGGTRDAENLCMIAVRQPSASRASNPSSLYVYLNFYTSEVSTLDSSFEVGAFPLASLYSNPVNSLTPLNPSCHLFESSKLLQASIHEQIQTNIYQFKVDVQLDPKSKKYVYEYAPTNFTSRQLTLKNDYVTLLNVEFPRYLPITVSNGDASSSASVPNIFLVLKGIKTEEAKSVALISYSRTPFGKIDFSKTKNLVYANKLDLIRTANQWKIWVSGLPSEPLPVPAIDETSDDPFTRKVWIAIFPTISKAITAELLVTTDKFEGDQSTHDAPTSLVVLRVLVAAFMACFLLIAIAKVIRHFFPGFCPRLSWCQLSTCYQRATGSYREEPINSSLTIPLEGGEPKSRATLGLYSDEDIWQHTESDDLLNCDTAVELLRERIEKELWAESNGVDTYSKIEMSDYLSPSRVDGERFKSSEAEYLQPDAGIDSILRKCKNIGFRRKRNIEGAKQTEMISAKNCNFREEQPQEKAVHATSTVESLPVDPANRGHAQFSFYSRGSSSSPNSDREEEDDGNSEIMERRVSMKGFFTHHTRTQSAQSNADSTTMTDPLPSAFEVDKGRSSMYGYATKSERPFTAAKCNRFTEEVSPDKL